MFLGIRCLKERLLKNTKFALPIPEERRTLSVICTPAESIKIKKYVAEVDPDSFATVMSLTNVWGKRFQDINEADNT